MKYINKLLLFILSIACIGYFSADANTNKNMSNEQVFIEIDSMPMDVKPGDKPITLDENLLKKLLPELRNPRLMSFKDLNTPDEQEGFLEGGYTFVLRGDFDWNGFADIAFVGKYDNPDHPNKNTFIAIVSIEGKKVLRKFFSVIRRDRILLIRVINYKPKIDAIGMSYNLASDDCGYLYWTGREWQYDECKTAF